MYHASEVEFRVRKVDELEQRVKVMTGSLPLPQRFSAGCDTQCMNGEMTEDLFKRSNTRII